MLPKTGSIPARNGWTGACRRWPALERFTHPAQQTVLQNCIDAVADSDARVTPSAHWQKAYFGRTVYDDPQLRGDDLQPLGPVFADAVHLGTASTAARWLAVTTDRSMDGTADMSGPWFRAEG